MWKLNIAVVLAAICCQVGSQTTKPECDIKVPDGPDCAKYSDACTSPERKRFCQRYCGLCSGGNASTTTIAAVTVKSAACVDTESVNMCKAYESMGKCGEPLAQKGCCKTCNAFSNVNSTFLSTTPKTSQTSSVLSTTVPSTQGKFTTVPSTPVKFTTVPSTQGKSTTVPSTPVKSTTVPSTQSKSTTVPSTQGISTTVPSTPDKSTTVPSTPDKSTTVPSTPGKSTMVIKSTVAVTTPAPATQTSTADAPTTRTLWKSAIQMKKVNGDFLQIQVVTFGYLKRETLNKIKSDVSELLKNIKPPITGVDEIDVEDGQTSGGETLTIQTLRAKVSSGQDPDDIKSKLNSNRPSFKNELYNKLSSQGIKLCDDQYELKSESPSDSEPSNASWAENNWYIIFAIGMAALIILGIIILTLTTASSRKRQKLQVQKEDAEKQEYTNA